MRWTSDDIPQLSGKTVLITGANSGLGLESARALAKRGATVLLACRTLDKADATARELRASTPDARVEPWALDLADLSSVQACAEQVVQRHQRLDVLLNNAGVMATPYMRTVDGFELQFGVNHLGHFALTGHLFTLLSNTPAARVVNVSSGAHRMGKLRLEDPHWEHGYKPWPAYGMSKLSNLLFTYELARRAHVAGLLLRSVAAHPGYSATNLQYRGPELAGAKMTGSIARAINPLLGQPASMGALPQLYAATFDDVQSGDYVGPGGPFEVRGYPKKVQSSERSRDSDAMRKLWELSERLTGVRYGTF
jgi:NAD(P)-dependent dehydrogenase (short-subunit alcohol dehydrogenase family)